ncbi:MAG: hypothetical protein ACJ790_04425 [Myxococcaceae bacterium]
MRNKLLGFVFVGAVIGATFAACGGDNPTGPTNCSADSDCQTGEICHPTAKFCVQSCTAGADCPDSAKNCDALTPGGTGPKFCQCSTTALCSKDNADQICRAVDKICAAKCTSDSECGGNGRTCVDGDCKAGTSNTDGGTDGGTGSCDWANCSSTAFGSGAQMCNGSSCGAGPTCTGSDQSTCSYGSFCNGGACGYPPRPQSGNVGTNACQNFYSGSHANGPAWNPSSSTGPVIYDVSEISHGTGSVPVGGTTCGGNFCECFDNQTEFKIRLRAYRTDTNWATNRNGFATAGPTLFYVNTSGTDRDVMANPRLLDPSTGYNTQSNPKDIEFQMWFCLDGTGINAFQPGFYFQGGNEACH